MSRSIAPEIREHIIAVIRRTAYPSRPSWWVERAIRLWEVGRLPGPCEQEAKGKGAGLEEGCRCQGCFERDVAALLSLVQRNAGNLPPEEWR